MWTLTTFVYGATQAIGYQSLIWIILNDYGDAPISTWIIPWGTDALLLIMWAIMKRDEAKWSCASLLMSYCGYGWLFLNNFYVSRVLSKRAPNTIGLHIRCPWVQAKALFEEATVSIVLFRFIPWWYNWQIHCSRVFHASVYLNF